MMVCHQTGTSITTSEFTGKKNNTEMTRLQRILQVEKIAT